MGANICMKFVFLIGLCRGFADNPPDLHPKNFNNNYFHYDINQVKGEKHDNTDVALKSKSEVIEHKLNNTLNVIPSPKVARTHHPKIILTYIARKNSPDNRMNYPMSPLNNFQRLLRCFLMNIIDEENLIKEIHQFQQFEEKKINRRGSFDLISKLHPISKDEQINGSKKSLSHMKDMSVKLQDEDNHNHDTPVEKGTCPMCQVSCNANRVLPTTLDFEKEENKLPFINLYNEELSNEILDVPQFMMKHKTKAAGDTTANTQNDLKDGLKEHFLEHTNFATTDEITNTPKATKVYNHDHHEFKIDELIKKNVHSAELSDKQEIYPRLIMTVPKVEVHLNTKEKLGLKGIKKLESHAEFPPLKHEKFTTQITTDNHVQSYAEAIKQIQTKRVEHIDKLEHVESSQHPEFQLVEANVKRSELGTSTHNSLPAVAKLKQVNFEEKLKNNVHQEKHTNLKDHTALEPFTLLENMYPKNKNVDRLRRNMVQPNLQSSVKIELHKNIPLDNENKPWHLDDSEDSYRHMFESDITDKYAITHDAEKNKEKSEKKDNLSDDVESFEHYLGPILINIKKEIKESQFADGGNPPESEKEPVQRKSRALIVTLPTVICIGAASFVLYFIIRSCYILFKPRPAFATVEAGMSESNYYHPK